MTCDTLSVPAFRRDTSPKGRGKSPSVLNDINDNLHQEILTDFLMAAMAPFSSRET